MPSSSKSIFVAPIALFSNRIHDLDMLKVGPYPWVVKQRVLSRTGIFDHAVSEYLCDPTASTRLRVSVSRTFLRKNIPIRPPSAEEALKRRPAESAFSGTPRRLPARPPQASSVVSSGYLSSVPLYVF